MAGRTSSFGAGVWDVYLIKTDFLGDTLWSRTYGGSSNDYGRSVQQTTDGGYIVTGGTYSFGAGGGDVYLIKTDSLGDTLWSRTYGGSSGHDGYSVQQTRDGGYIVAGYTESFGAGGYDVMLTKLDSLGNACIGEFVTKTVSIPSCSITAPATVVTSTPSVMTGPPTEVTSPPGQLTTVCQDPLVCGDVNGDVEVNLSDIVYFINYLFQGGDPPQCPYPYTFCTDCNGDGAVGLPDVVHLINYVLKSGPDPIC